VCGLRGTGGRHRALSARACSCSYPDNRRGTSERRRERRASTLTHFGAGRAASADPRITLKLLPYAGRALRGGRGVERDHGFAEERAGLAVVRQRYDGDRRGRRRGSVDRDDRGLSRAHDTRRADLSDRRALVAGQGRLVLLSKLQRYRWSATGRDRLRLRWCPERAGDLSHLRPFRPVHDRSDGFVLRVQKAWARGISRGPFGAVLVLHLGFVAQVGTACASRCHDTWRRRRHRLVERGSR
jgi:hypothetical protein